MFCGRARAVPPAAGPLGTEMLSALSVPARGASPLSVPRRLGLNPLRFTHDQAEGDGVSPCQQRVRRDGRRSPNCLCSFLLAIKVRFTQTLVEIQLVFGEVGDASSHALGRRQGVGGSASSPSP